MCTTYQTNFLQNSAAKGRNFSKRKLLQKRLFFLVVTLGDSASPKSCRVWPIWRKPFDYQRHATASWFFSGSKPADWASSNKAEKGWRGREASEGAVPVTTSRSGLVCSSKTSSICRAEFTLTQTPLAFVILYGQRKIWWLNGGDPWPLSSKACLDYGLMQTWLHLHKGDSKN